MKTLKALLLLPLLTLVPCVAAAAPPTPQSEDTVPSREEVIGLLTKVNDQWQSSHQEHEDSFWNRAVYHTGNLAAFETTRMRDYLDYTEAWAEKNKWRGAASNDKTKWVYNYGEKPEHVLFGDWQTCFQIYLDLNQLNPDEQKIARAKEVMEYQITTPAEDYLWWADGFYMVMPVMTKMHKLTGNPLYLEKLYTYFSYGKKLMLDPETGLFFRDAKYLYPQHKTANGLKDFWARGNGWIFAAIPRVLEDLPANDPHRDEYIKVYQTMAKTLVSSQQAEGYWTRSILDPAHAPGPETSGTAFFTYGYLWGINNGLLDKKTYLPVAMKGWNYLTKTAIQPDGALGYVQPIGEKAIPGQVVDAKSTADFGVGAFLLASSEMVKLIDQRMPAAQKKSVQSDREYWTDLAYKTAEPVLRNMSNGELKKNMLVEVSPTWDGRNKNVTYMEAFGRLMAGLAPWLALPDDDTKEGKQRKQLREWALKSYANGVDPQSPDYLGWQSGGQTLVDAAYVANSFLRAPKQLWEPLDEVTKKRYIAEFQGLRRYSPVYSNWVLFTAMTETFLMSVGAEYDIYRVDMGLHKIEEWYVGDSWYSDGEHFAFDYYSSYVIQPMYVEVMQAFNKTQKTPKITDKRVATGLQRMQRFGSILERFVSPEGSFPAVGRSMTYRMGVFQALSLLALQERLPSELPPGQVRSALTAVMKRMYANPDNFNKEGFLQLGFVGHQPDLADVYTNNGSLYMTSLVFLPLGLPADHPFWTAPAQDWTQKKAWSAQPFPKDHAIRN